MGRLLLFRVLGEMILLITIIVYQHNMQGHNTEYLEESEIIDLIQATGNKVEI